MTYDYCDKLLKAINRKNLRLFDRLRLIRFDELKYALRPLPNKSESHLNTIRIA